MECRCLDSVDACLESHECDKLGSRLMTTFGRICVTIAFTLEAVTIFAYFYFVFPFVLNPHSFMGLTSFLISAFITFNLFFNYTMVVWTSPGQPATTLTEEELAQLEQEQQPERGKGWSKFCKKCRVPKPPRAHHCHICDHCVLKMDHHCPWINGCVGHHNHRYFFLFLLWVWIASSYGAITIILYEFGWINSGVYNQRQQADAHGYILVTGIMCFCLMMVMAPFTGWNFYLLSTGQTTIEYHYNQEMITNSEKAESEYDLGTLNNMVVVFGDFEHVLQVILPSIAPLPTNGTRFFSRQDVLEVL